MSTALVTFMDMSSEQGCMNPRWNGAEVNDTVLSVIIVWHLSGFLVERFWFWSQAQPKDPVLRNKRPLKQVKLFCYHRNVTYVNVKSLYWWKCQTFCFHSCFLCTRLLSMKVLLATPSSPLDQWQDVLLWWRTMTTESKQHIYGMCVCVFTKPACS